MMKNFLLALSALLLFQFAQAQTKSYTTTSGELIFSFAEYKNKGNDVTTPVRFTCFFHAAGNMHHDFNDKVGIYYGLAIRNVGFTSTQNDTFDKVKRRMYTLGVPLAIKIGNLKEDTYLYAGGEVEFGFHYKEKSFVNDNKISKETAWFSDRVNAYQPSAFIGVNFKYGLNLKFKYYFNDFYNTSYVENGRQLYKDVQSSNMFYISLAANIRTSSYSTGSTYNKGL